MTSQEQFTPQFLYEDDDFVAFFKTPGQRTHAVSPDQWGLVETLSHHSQKNLSVIHRLDKETSGVILFAKNKTASQEFFQLFEKNLVKKTYFFLTDRPLILKPFSVESHIEKKDKIYLNNQSKEANSKTDFSFIQEINHHNQKYYLWEAQPLTGKPHQIRLHAELSGIPLLGDREHGGTPWVRMALHAHDIAFSWKGKHIKITAPLPHLFHKPSTLIGDLLEQQWQSQHQQFLFSENQCFRLLHRQMEGVENRVDYFNKVIWVYWYSKNAPTTLDIESLNHFCASKNLHWVIRHMIDRGSGAGHDAQKNLYTSAHFENTGHHQWTAFENKIQVELRLDQGFSPGLFLDQRENRKWVYANSAKKDVLNLFSYTSAFSVAAASGGAKQVTTVDASPVFLNWSKENFKLNRHVAESYEFFAQDSLLFLNGSIKRQRQWDLIICDPPSFGRTKTTVWKIDRQFPELLKGMWDCLKPQGRILFTCNYEKWSLMDLKKIIQKELKNKKFQIENLPCPGMDYEFFDAYDNLLKGVFIQKLK